MLVIITAAFINLTFINIALFTDTRSRLLFKFSLLGR
ncbi:hypothetical protein NYA8BAC_00402 [Psychrobacter okhotskensis]|jgi:hypothetical protein